MLEAEKQLIDRMRSIPGLMTSEELTLLCRMARSASSILELGSYKGRSLAAMALSNPRASMYSIDWFGDMSHRGYQGSTLEETKKNFEQMTKRTATFIVGKTDEVVEQSPQGIDLLHIDAGHSYEECLSDLKNYTPRINPGGAVCIHDYGPAKTASLDRPEVQQAVDDWRNDAFVEVGRAGTMIAFRKLIAEEGVLFVAYGEKALAHVSEAIASIRKWRGKLPIAVITDSAKDIPGATFRIPHIDLDKGARSIKTRMYQLSPFRKTLYLDADTIVLSDPQHGFKMLDQYVELVMGQDSTHIFNRTKWPALNKDEVRATIEETDGGELCYYNSGVLFFRRSDRLQRLFSQWHSEWTRWGQQDQPSLLRALYKNPVRLASMRSAWNTHERGAARFVFHAHRTVRRDGAPR